MKIGVNGTGAVGNAVANAAMLVGVAHEIVLIDRDETRARAWPQDSLHAPAVGHACVVRAGRFADLGGAEAVIISAGGAQKPGGMRPQLRERNAAVIEPIIPPALEAAPQALVVVADNAVDIVTEVATPLAGLPSGCDSFSG